MSYALSDILVRSMLTVSESDQLELTATLSNCLIQRSNLVEGPPEKVGTCSSIVSARWPFWKPTKSAPAGGDVASEICAVFNWVAVESIFNVGRWK